MLGRKKYAEPDYLPCCIYCEYALPQKGDEQLVRCMRKRKRPERGGGFGCQHFRYDLLKHQPSMKKPPEPLEGDPEKL